MNSFLSLFYNQFKSQGNWRHWNDLKKSKDQFNNTKIREIIVPTMDTARYKFIIDLCINNNRPLLYVGPTGTGKSVYVQEKLMRDIDKNLFTAYFINFSAQTSANQTQVGLSYYSQTLIVNQFIIFKNFLLFKLSINNYKNSDYQ